MLIFLSLFRRMYNSIIEILQVPGSEIKPTF